MSGEIGRVASRIEEPSEGPGGGRILVVQNDADKSLGRLAGPLRQDGVQLDVRAPDGERPGVFGYDGLIVLPGLADPVDETPAVRWARAAIEDALEAGLPVLGVCLGGQLLIQALGGSVRPCRPELGFGVVSASSAAAGDPLLEGAPDRFLIFHAHAFAFDPPSGSEILLTNEVSVQAARYGEAWAFQCHPEVTHDWVGELARAIGGQGGAVGPLTADFFRRHAVSPHQLESDADLAEPAMGQIGERIGQGFSERLTRSAARRR